MKDGWKPPANNFELQKQFFEMGGGSMIIIDGWSIDWP